MSTTTNQEWVTVTHKKPRKIPSESSPYTQPQPQQEKPWYEPETVVLKKSTKPPTQKFIKMSTPNSAKNLSVSHHHRKVEETSETDTGDVSAKIKYPDEFRKKILNARTAQSLTQKQFALKLHVKEGIIRDIENNTAVYDPSLAERLNRQLQTTV